eukprot:gene26478-57798_t
MAAADLGAGDVITIEASCSGGSQSTVLNVIALPPSGDPLPGGGRIVNNRANAIEVPAGRPLKMNMVLPPREKGMLGRCAEGDEEKNE